MCVCVCIHTHTHIYVLFKLLTYVLLEGEKKSITLRKKPIWKLESCQGNKHVTIFLEGNEWCTD